MATFTVSTKTDKDAQAQQTALTIDFEGCSEEVLREIATSAIVVKWQGQVRKQGIPSKAHIKAVDYRPGTRLVPAPVTMDQLLSKMSAEEKQKLLEKLMGE